MLRKMKHIVLAASLLLAFGAGNFAVAHAEDFKGDACSGVNTLDSGSSSSTCSSGSGVTSLVKSIVTILSYAAGIAAVIMIIIAGFTFITAGGDTNKVTAARHTLIYALVGLAIAALAQFLVHFALTQATGDVCPTEPSISKTDAACKP